MTVSATPPRNDYLGNNTTDTYSYSFRIFDETDLRVTQRDTDDVETNLVYPTDFTVTGVNRPSGGTIVLTAGNLPTGETLTIDFNRTPIQETDLRNQGAFFPETHEDKFDELTRYIQALKQSVDGSIHLPPSEDPDDFTMVLPVSSERANKAVWFDNDGNLILTDSGIETTAVSSYAATLLDDADAAAARATLGAGAAGDSVFTSATAADARTALGLGDIATQTLAQVGFTTGDVKLTFKDTADSSWVLMDDKTIGDASSGATGRANADTAALYALIWGKVTDQWAPVTGGRGANAEADFAAHKPLALPKTLGRALAGYGTGTVTDSGGNADVDTGAANTLTVPANNTKWITGMPVVFTLASGTITGLTSSTTYYVIRSSSTLIKLASTLALAQAGTEIDLTAKSSPVWTITHTYTARVMGEAAGEQSHAMSSTEQLAHTHGLQNAANVKRQAAGVDFANGAGTALTTSTITVDSTGGNAAMNITPPTLFLNVMVKL